MLPVRQKLTGKAATRTVRGMRNWLLVTALAALSACGRSAAPRIHTDIPPKTFVAVMVELGSSQPHQRAVILQKHRVTDQQLRQFVAAYSRYPQQFSLLLDTVQARLSRHQLPGP